MGRPKRYTSAVLLICLIALASCTVYKGIKYGNAAVDDYTTFRQDTVNKGSWIFTFAELKKKDPLFDSLRIEHLLDMTAGLKFKEKYSWNPFSRMARLYLGNDAMKVVKGMKFLHKPGEHCHYDSMTTQILGIVIEGATGKPYAQYNRCVFGYRQIRGFSKHF